MIRLIGGTGYIGGTYKCCIGDNQIITTNDEFLHITTLFFLTILIIYILHDFQQQDRNRFWIVLSSCLIPFQLTILMPSNEMITTFNNMMLGCLLVIVIIVTITHILICRYVCDPVLGDNGKYYVPPAMINIFIEKLIPRLVSCMQRIYNNIVSDNDDTINCLHSVLRRLLLYIKLFLIINVLRAYMITPNQFEVKHVT